MTRVLPLPAPATISNGPSTCVTASRCASVRSFNNSSLDTTAPQYGRAGGASKRGAGAAGNLVPSAGLSSRASAGLVVPNQQMLSGGSGGNNALPVCGKPIDQHSSACVRVVAPVAGVHVVLVEPVEIDAFCEYRHRQRLQPARDLNDERVLVVGRRAIAHVHVTDRARNGVGRTRLKEQ